jgi:transcription initiation factor TFIIF subunit beta
MATLQGTGMPRVKLESLPDANVKSEPMGDTPSPYSNMDDVGEYEDDGSGDLDMSRVQQQIWFSHIPKTLWETLLALNDDDEVEIGTIRVEGSESNPSRVHGH